MVVLDGALISAVLNRGRTLEPCSC